jgi:Spy/CpxP family protein refolding chaperone
MMATSIKKNLVRAGILLLIGIFFLPSIASAFRQGYGKSEKGMGRMHMRAMQWPSFHIWNNPEIVEKLDLSDEQINELKEADFSMKENHLEFRSQLHELNLEMEKAYLEKPVDEPKVLKIANKMSEIRNDMFMDRIESRLKMTNILTDEQFEQLNALKVRNPENRRDFGKFGGRAWEYCPRNTMQQ